MSTSQTPTLVKLPKVGDTLTLAVMSCALAKIGSYPEVEFVGLDGKNQFVAIRVPQKSADRQLERCEITDYNHVAGKLLTFGRDPNAQHPSKPYWSITNEGDAPVDVIARFPREAAPAPQAAAATSQASTAGNGNGSASHTPSNGVGDREKYSTAYKRITEFVLADIVPLYEAKKIPITAEVCHAMAATLFIGVTRNGY